MAKLSEVNVKEVTVKEFADFIVALESEIPNLLTMVLKGKFGVVEKPKPKLTYCEQQEMERYKTSEVHIKEIQKKLCTECKNVNPSCLLRTGVCDYWEAIHVKY